MWHTRKAPSFLCSRCSLRASLSRNDAATPQKFTTSQRRLKHGNVATFTPTSNPELDGLLSSFRKNIFVPAHLSQMHRDIMHQERHAYLFRNEEPLVVEVGIEKVQLHQMDPMTDEPSTHRGFARMLALMKQPEDWNNVTKLLEELRIARRNIKQPQIEKMVRKASEVGRQDVILDCARKVKRTGLVLKDPRLVMEVMLGLRQYAQTSGWSKDAVLRALNQGEQVFLTMEDPNHLGGQTITKGDPRVQPEIIGVVLELAVINAVKHHGARDVDGKVSTYLQRVIATWNNLQPQAASTAPQEASNRLLALIPLWHALTEAGKLVQDTGPEAEWVKDKSHHLTQAIADERRVIDSADGGKKPQRGIQALEATSR